MGECAGIARRHLDFEDRADLLGLRAVDDQLQPLLDERIQLGVDDRLEAEQALLARDVAPFEQLRQQRGPVRRSAAKIVPLAERRALGEPVETDEQELQQAS